MFYIFTLLFNHHSLFFFLLIMRNLLTSVVFALLLAVSFSSCGGSVDFSKPDSVAMAFAAAMADNDLDKAASYSDESTAEMLKKLAPMMKMAAADPKQKEKSAAAKKNLKSAKCTESGDKATCELCCDVEMNKVELVKKDGKWKVSMNKENKEAPKPVNEPAPEPTPATDTTAN